MSEQFNRQVVDFFTSRNEDIPDGIRSWVELNLTTSRETLLGINSAAKNSAKAFEHALATSYSGAKTVAEKVMLSAEANTKAAYDTALLILHAKSLSEVASLQTKYLQSQAVELSVQTKEFLVLSTRAAEQAIEAMNATATKTFDELRMAG